MPKTLLKPTGSYLVGHLDMEFMHPTVTNSTILTRVFYPSNLEKISHEKSIENNYDNWIPSSAYFGGYGKVFSLPTFISIPVFRMFIGNLKLNSAYGLPMLDKQQLPVVVFSHGLYGNRTTYSILCTEFASRGWVVFALEHHDGSASHSVIKGAPFDYVKLKKDQDEFEMRNKQLAHRTDECISLVEILKKINQGETIENLLNEHKNKQISSDFLKSKLNFDHAIIAGHSFGGATAIRVSQHMDLFKTAIAYDPWIFPIEKMLLKEPKRSVPTLINNSTKFQSNTHMELIFDYLKAMKVRNEVSNEKLVSFKIKETNHDVYSDIPSVMAFSSSKLLHHHKIIEIIFTTTFEFLNKCKHVSPEQTIEPSKNFFNSNNQLYSNLEMEYPF